MFSVTGSVNTNKAVRASVVNEDGNMQYYRIINPPGDSYSFSVDEGQKVVIEERNLEKEVDTSGPAADKTIE